MYFLSISAGCVEGGQRRGLYDRVQAQGHCQLQHLRLAEEGLYEHFLRAHRALGLQLFRLEEEGLHEHFLRAHRALGLHDHLRLAAEGLHENFVAVEYNKCIHHLKNWFF